MFSMTRQTDDPMSTESLVKQGFFGIYLFAFTICAICSLIYVWPASDQVPDKQIIAIALLAGALGSQIHALASFAAHAGNNQFDSAWGWWFVFRPILGALLALVFYFSIHGGLLLMVDSEASSIRVSGLAAISMLVGLFTEQATHKLKELFDTLFAVNGKPTDTNNKPKAVPQSTVTSLKPSTVKKCSPDTLIELVGKNLKEGMQVTVDDGETYQVSPAQDDHYTFTLPKQLFLEVGEKKLDVLSKNKTKIATLQLKVVPN